MWTWPTHNNGDHSEGSALEVLCMRGIISQVHSWEVMPNLCFYRNPKEIEKDEQGAAEKAGTKETFQNECTALVSEFTATQPEVAWWSKGVVCLFSSFLLMTGLQFPLPHHWIWRNNHWVALSWFCPQTLLQKVEIRLMENKKFLQVFFFPFISTSWRPITLQYCSGFCHTLTWISHGFTCIPHPVPPSLLPLYLIPLGLPSAPGPSTCLMHPTCAGGLFHPR